MDNERIGFGNARDLNLTPIKTTIIVCAIACTLLILSLLGWQIVSAGKGTSTNNCNPFSSSSAAAAAAAADASKQKGEYELVRDSTTMYGSNGENERESSANRSSSSSSKHAALEMKK